MGCPEQDLERDVDARDAAHATEKRAGEIMQEMLEKDYSLIELQGVIETTGQLVLDDISTRIYEDRGAEIVALLSLMLKVRNLNYKPDAKKAQDQFNKLFESFCKSADEYMVRQCEKAASKELRL